MGEAQGKCGIRNVECGMELQKEKHQIPNKQNRSLIIWESERIFGLAR